MWTPKTFENAGLDKEQIKKIISDRTLPELTDFQAQCLYEYNYLDTQSLVQFKGKYEIVFEKPGDTTWAGIKYGKNIYLYDPTGARERDLRNARGY